MDLFAALDRLDALRLPRDQYAVFGSGPLAVRGIRPAADLDIVVLPGLWADLAARLPLAPKAGAPRILVEEIEIWPDWHPAAGPPAEIVATADVFDGYRFATLARVLAWKRALARPKDVTDVELITRYLARGGS